MGDTSSSPPPLPALYSTTRGLYLRALEPSKVKPSGGLRQSPGEVRLEPCNWLIDQGRV